MTDSDTADEWEGESFAEALPGIIAVATLGFAATAAVLGHGQFAGVIAVVGWLLLTPLTAVLADTELVRSLGNDASSNGAAANRSRPVDDDVAALEELKRRYARGEIDEAEFERRTAMLVENESIADVRDRVDRRTEARDPSVQTSERDREREYQT
jgi:uncharacterized membrane protein